VSVGLTVFPDDPGESDELLRHADRALYAAKAAGCGTWRRFTPDGSAERPCRASPPSNERAIRGGREEVARASDGLSRPAGP
jgi:GGDEF domain-containing protein